MNTTHAVAIQQESVRHSVREVKKQLKKEKTQTTGRERERESVCVCVCVYV